jgi:hypothetical protein
LKTKILRHVWMGKYLSQWLMHLCSDVPTNVGTSRNEMIGLWVMFVIFGWETSRQLLGCLYMLPEGEPALYAPAKR